MKRILLTLILCIITTPISATYEPQSPHNQQEPSTHALPMATDASSNRERQREDEQQPQSHQAAAHDEQPIVRQNKSWQSQILPFAVGGLAVLAFLWLKENIGTSSHNPRYIEVRILPDPPAPHWRDLDNPAWNDD